LIKIQLAKYGICIIIRGIWTAIAWINLYIIMTDQEWGLVIAAVSAIIAGLLIWFIVHQKKSLVPKIINNVCSQLQQAGIEAHGVTKGSIYLEKLGHEQKIEGDLVGVCDIRDGDIAYIRYVIYTGYGRSDNYLEYLVGRNTPKKGISKQEGSKFKQIVTSISWGSDTSLSVRKTKPIFGRVVDISWEGDVALSQQLNSDYELKDTILQHYRSSKASKHILKIEIYNYSKNYGYAIIRTAHLEPTIEDFEIMKIIARHIKSTWFGK